VLKKLGKYEVTELVGRGAMGEVYIAHDPLIGRLVALKTITNGLAGRPDLLERFHQEARSAGTLQHPNIVTIYELGQEGETPFIAMEFLEGESLDGLIQRRPALTITQKLNYIIPVCRALNFAHKRGVIHRDIKPANVMISNEGVVKVVDFGIARQMESSVTQTDALLGTLAYMSPQQIRGERADARSDIWATGVMLYELLTFQRPFDGANQAALVLNISSNDVLPPSVKTIVPDCGRPLEALVDRMLAKDIERRYQNMEQVLHAFEGVFERLQRSTSTKTIAVGNELAATRMTAMPRPAPRPAASAAAAYATPLPKIAQSYPVQQPLPAAAASGPVSSLIEQLKSHRKPILIGLSLLVLLGIANSYWSTRRSAADDSAAPAAAPASAVADLPSAPPRKLPMAPGVVATRDELSQPWAGKEFIFHNTATAQFVPAMVVRLPSGGYWGFSLIEPYGHCRLQYVTDLEKLQSVYGYRADHPLVADPCNKTLFDLARYGGPSNAEVRGDIVHGSSVIRPPIAIEVQERGDSILATQMEAQ
jgi:serine/threonine protein kinase